MDKPWLSYFDENAVSGFCSEKTVYNAISEFNGGNLNGIALIYFGHEITYGELLDNVTAAAKGFIALGVKAGDIVTVFSSNTPETAYCLLALNFIGAVPDLEYVTISEKEAVAAVARYKSSVVVILDLLAAKYQKLGEQDSVKSIVVLSASASMPFKMRLAAGIKTAGKIKTIQKGIDFGTFTENGRSVGKITPCKYKKDSPAAIVHSGGTTGIPKSVILTNENINYIAWAFLQNNSDVHTGDKYMAYIPFFHAFGLCMGFTGPLCHGLAVILAPLFDEKNLLKDFKRYKPNHIMASGAHMPALMHDRDIQKMDLSFLITCGSGGSPLTKVQENDLIEFLAAHNSVAKASLGYGMSELASAVCVKRNGYTGKLGSVGIPLPLANVKVLDTDTGKELKYNETGELCFSTPGLMLGYYQNDEETEKAIFTDDAGTRWIHTGDLGYVDEDGFVFVSGRIKRIYSTRSGKGGTMYKMFPDYIETTIGEVENVSDCACVCIEHPDYRSIAVAYVVLKDPEHDSYSEIMDHISEILPSHSIPKAINFVSSFPFTQIGKIDYHALEEEAKLQFPQK